MEVMTSQGRIPTQEQRSGAQPCQQQRTMLLSRNRFLIEGTLDLGAPPSVHLE